MNTFVQAIYRTTKLDIGFVNYQWGRTPEYSKKLYPENGILKEFARQIGRLIYSIKWKVKTIRQSKTSIEDKVVFFADSHNQYSALKPVKGRVPQSVFWVEKQFDGEVRFPAVKARAISLVFLPVLIYRLIIGDIQFWTLKYGLANYLDGYGYFFVAFEKFKKEKPKAIVLSNDHGPETRGILTAAKQLNIPSIYIQHASVTSFFPPLEFSLALLDGEHSKDTYQISNKSCVIHLVGNTKRIRKELAGAKSTQQHKVTFGLAFNDMDSLDRVTKLCADINKYFPNSTFKLRPHPADPRFNKFYQLANELKWEFSDPRIQDVWSFFSGMDFLIAGSSNILLDAAFSRVIPIQPLELVQDYDHYGFRSTGLVKLVKNWGELELACENIEEMKGKVVEQARYYDVTFGTEEDGRAPEIAANIIRQSLLNVDGKEWYDFS